MAKKKGARKTTSDVGNPFTLLARAFDEGNLKTCLELLTNIYVYLRRRMPPDSLRRSWREELGFNSRFDREKSAMVFRLLPSAILPSKRHPGDVITFASTLISSVKAGVTAGLITPISPAQCPLTATVATPQKGECS